MKHALSGVLRGSRAEPPQISWRSTRRRTTAGAVVAVPMAGVFLVLILGLGLHVNLSASAPRGLYRTVIGSPRRGGLGGGLPGPRGCSARTRARLSRTRTLRGGRTAVLKRVVAVAGDVVEIGPDMGDGERSASSRQLVRWRRHSRPGAAACGVGAVRRRRGRALAREHAGSQQLGQPLHRADCDLAGLVRRPPGMDGRLMSPCSSVAGPEAGG
jgi:type IV secretory pathway protease TraF